MRTDRTDIWDEEVFVGDTVRVGFKSYMVKYGNYKHLGVDKIGIYAENASQSHPADIVPLIQLKSFVRVKKEDAILG